MEIFNASQIRACDQYTIQHEPISSIDLMERAANACCSNFLEKYSAEHSFYIFCGKGNNGGDGFALARLLCQKGYRVSVFYDSSDENFSPDAQENFLKLGNFSEIALYDFDEINHLSISKKDLIVDALFGTGLNRPIEGRPKQLIDFLNNINSIKIAIDVPSGLYADKLPAEDPTVFKADYTLSFGFYKRSFLHPESAKFAGEIHILDIGLSQDFINQEITSNFIISEEEILRIFKPRNSFSHKGNFGKAVLVGGSYGKIGAVTMAALAALKSGAGLTFALAPDCGCRILQTCVPEAMFISGGDKFISQIKLPSEDCTVGIGTGLGTEKETVAALKEFLEKVRKPLVLDADALNVISENKDFISLLPENSILTPHPKEFERLFGKIANTLEAVERAREKAQEHRLILVLKGHRTAVLTPDGNCYYNLTGNAGMAKGGSGDVLTGIITALLAQNYSPEEAAKMGVFIHGKAGDIAAEKFSQEAMSPLDIIGCLSEVFLKLRGNSDF